MLHMLPNRSLPGTNVCKSPPSSASKKGVTTSPRPQAHACTGLAPAHLGKPAGRQLLCCEAQRGQKLFDALLAGARPGNRAEPLAVHPHCSHHRTSPQQGLGLAVVGLGKQRPAGLIASGHCQRQKLQSTVR